MYIKLPYCLLNQTYNNNWSLIWSYRAIIAFSKLISLRSHLESNRKKSLFCFASSKFLLSLLSVLLRFARPQFLHLNWILMILNLFGSKCFALFCLSRKIYIFLRSYYWKLKLKWPINQRGTKSYTRGIFDRRNRLWYFWTFISFF